MKKVFQIVGILILVIGPAWWMTHIALTQSGIVCEVCVSFNGQENCAKAQGETKQTCRTTATDTACGPLTQGVQQSIQCSQKEPVRIDFD